MDEQEAFMPVPETPAYAAFSDLMQTRRSIRRFRPDPVDDETIKLLIDTVRHAPSAGNAQPWDFIVVRDKEMKEKIREIFVEQLRPKYKMEQLRDRGLWFTGARPIPEPAAPFCDAPVLIVVTGDPRLQDAYWYRVKLDKGHQHMVSSLATIVYSMHLACASLGLASHYVSDTASPDMQTHLRSFLGYPEPLWAYEMIPIGYADMTVSNRFVHESEDFVHWEKYDISRHRSDQEIKEHIMKKIRPQPKPKAE